MSTYLQKFGAAATDHVNRFSQAIAGRSFEAPQIDIPDGVGTVAGLAAGSYIGYKNGGHWLIGAMAGASLGRNVPALVMHPEQRPAAIGNLITTGVAVVGSMMTKNNRALGFAIGYLAAAAATYYGGLK